MRRLALWGPVVVYMAAIFFVSSLPDLTVPETGPSDKAWHSGTYAGLAMLVARALAGGLPARIGISTMALAIAITTAYGASDELHQLFVPGRSAEWFDLYADAAGACIGTAACWGWGIISRSRHGL